MEMPGAQQSITAPPALMHPGAQPSEIDKAAKAAVADALNSAHKAAKVKPAKVKPASESLDMPEPCIGLPVQFYTGNEYVPGTLRRQSKVDPESWELIVFLHGATSLRQRTGKYSETPQAGTWRYPTVD
jgi:hypothetical protein